MDGVRRQGEVMQKQIVENLLNRFNAYSDLAKELDEDLLTKKIDLPKHKSLAEHLWCVVGVELRSSDFPRFLGWFQLFNDGIRN